ncbi:MAG: cupin domain-containing protein [Anaerolineae bacterium]
MRKVEVQRYAERLNRPFLMAGLAMVDHYLVSAYSCQGTMAWHRHLDEDEMFIGYSGTGTIETTWGSASLGFCELVTVPKGLAHRSMALLPAVLLIAQTRGQFHRRNGHQRFADSSEGRLSKVSVAMEAAKLNDVYTPQRIATCDTLGVSVQVCLGSQQWHRHQGDQLIFCQYGELAIEGEGMHTPVARGEFVLVEGGEQHRVTAGEPATAMVMARVE